MRVTPPPQDGPEYTLSTTFPLIPTLVKVAFVFWLNYVPQFCSSTYFPIWVSALIFLSSASPLLNPSYITAALFSRKLFSSHSCPAKYASEITHHLQGNIQTLLASIFQTALPSIQWHAWHISHHPITLSPCLLSPMRASPRIKNRTSCLIYVRKYKIKVGSLLLKNGELLDDDKVASVLWHYMGYQPTGLFPTKDLSLIDNLFFLLKFEYLFISYY